MRFLCACVLACALAAASSVAAAAVTAKEMIERIKAATGAQAPANTVDTIKAGDPETPVTGIATTFMDTLDVLQRAAASGKNLVISHEPTFYGHLDRTAGLEDDPVYQAKAKFIREHHMVVFRFHDLWHMRKPDGIMTGMVAALDWQKFQSTTDPKMFTFPPTSLESFAAATRDKLHIRTLRVVGDPQRKITHVAFLPGASGFQRQMQMFRKDGVDALVVGEAVEWEMVPYAQDAIAAGMPKALIILGHDPSEEQGMKECADWISTFVKDIPVEFVPAREPFWTPR